MNTLDYRCTDSAYESVTYKIVIYKCRCEITLGAFLQYDAPFSCKTHGEGIKKVITVEEYRD